MKTKLLILILWGIVSQVIAQAQPDTTERRFYVGLGVNNTSYLVTADYSQFMSGNVTPIIYANWGYRLSNRTIIQIGASYGENELDAGSIYVKSTDSLVYKTNFSKTKGVAVPITIRFTPFNPHKRIQLYATASVAPVMGTVSRYRADSMNKASPTILEDRKVSFFSVFATGGLMLNWKMSSRFESYAEGNFLYKNLSNQSNYADSKPISFGLGLNYKF